MKNSRKRKFFIFFSIGIIIIIGFLFWKINRENYNVYLIDEEDGSYLLTGINNHFELEILSSEHNNYFITDIQGNERKCNCQYKNNKISISFQDELIENHLYILTVQGKDKIINDKFNNAKLLYLIVGENNVTEDMLKYNLINVNFQENYSVNDNKIVFNNLIAKMKNELLNKTKDVLIKNYKLYYDNQLVSNNTVESKIGVHHIKISFEYNNDEYIYEKDINVLNEYEGLTDEEIIKKAQNMFEQANQTIKDIIYASHSSKQESIKIDDITGKIRTDSAANSSNCTIYNVIDQVNNQKVSTIQDVKNIFYSLFDKHQKIPNIYKINNRVCSKFKFGYDGIDKIKVLKIISKNEGVITFQINGQFNNDNISFTGQLIHKDNQWKVYDFLNDNSKYHYSDY